jgi:hypothetical protein
LIRSQRRWFVHLLSVALLLAQLGMQVHAATHLNSDPHGAASGQLCGECASFAPLQNMAGGAAATIIILRVTHERVQDLGRIADVPARFFNAFQSRAPPAFL